jgi:RNA polymerase sigma-70 factor (ECF subfamily)
LEDASVASADASLVAAALEGDRKALSLLVDRLTPVIQARAAHWLLRQRGARTRSIRQEVEDLTQEVFLSVFAQDGKILRSWEPERGLTLEKFIGLVAERQVVSILRTHKRNPWTEDPTLSEDMDATLPSAMPTERVVASRDALDQLFERLKLELSPLAWRLFDLVFLQELSVEEVMAATAMSADAVYAWRSRLSRLARKRYAELEGEAASAPRVSKGSTQ